MKKISLSAIDMVRTHEGLRLAAYRCPAGVWTIGYGHTKTAKPGMRITPAQAEELLAADLEEAAAVVDKAVTVRLLPNERDALASFVFNIGPAAFRTSTLLKKLNTGDRAGAAAEFARWTKATVNGKKVSLPGLVRRRADEAAMFLGDADEPMPQAVEAPAEMKPLSQSRTVQTGVGGLSAAAIVTAISEAKEVSGAVQDAVGSLPPGAMGWAAAAVLAAAVAFMLWRRVQDKRQAEAA